LLLRTGVVAALALGSLAVTEAPALAAPPSVTITQLSSTTLGPGQSAQLRYTVSSQSIGGGGNGRQQVDISVNVSSNNLSCSGACGSRETIGDSGEENFSATLRASNNLPPGSNQTVTISISASNNDGNSQAARQQITLRGPDAPQTVRSVSGRVVNVANGKGIADATVALNDGSGHSYTTQTDRTGNFKFTSSDDKPISPGQLLLAAGKEGFQNNQTSSSASAGQAKSGLQITLRSTTQPSASASAESPTPEDSVEAPTDEASTDASIDPAAAGDNQNSDSGGGTFSWVLIILGGLLVALGVGAIVLLVIRRKDGGEDGTGDPLPGPNGPRPTPGAQGVFRGGADPTMVAGGAPMGGGPTMAMRPGLADAPTMMHKPLDEYGDPYGTSLRAPQPTSGPPPGATQPGYGYQGMNQGGYGPGGSPAAPMGPGSPGAPTGYGNAAPTGYGPPAGRAPASASPADPYAPREPHDTQGYPAPAPQGGGYGYDEPTGRYDPNGGYGQASGGYDQDRGGYGQAGSGNGYNGGYGSSNGYGQQDNGYSPNGGYDSPPRGGYDDGRYQPPPPSGYGPPQGGNGYDGYDQQQQGGYPSYEQGGQGGQGGYDQGYYDEQRDRGERGGGRSGRRSLDWLDD
jgi:hypothetical protein